MAMPKKFTASSDKPEKPAKSGPPRTTDGNQRAFDMRPRPSDDRRREDPRDRAIRPTDAPEKLLDPDPAE